MSAAKGTTTKGTTTATHVFDLNREEIRLVRMYRELSRWDKNAVYIIVASIAHGHLGPKTDSYSWPKIRKDVLGLDEVQS